VCQAASDYVTGMRNLLASMLGVAVLALAPTPSSAADNVVLVELFTSQGCSSCPPADKNLGDLADLDGVLGLSMHVDYWDYLGWRDTFARRKHTDRQFAYRDYMGARVVYTPQMIVHGTNDVPGYRPAMIKSTIQDILSADRGASIKIGDDGGMLKATITADAAGQPRTIFIATYTKAATVNIKRGENAGRAITYHNIVDELMTVGPWQGPDSQSVSLPKPNAGGGTAIWLQEDQTGRILAASYIEG